MARAISRQDFGGRIERERDRGRGKEWHWGNFPPAYYTAEDAIVAAAAAAILILLWDGKNADEERDAKNC